MHDIPAHVLLVGPLPEDCSHIAAGVHLADGVDVVLGVVVVCDVALIVTQCRGSSLSSVVAAVVSRVVTT